MNTNTDPFIAKQIQTLIDRAATGSNGISDEAAWIEVIRHMDSIYADLVRYQVELEEKNAVLEDAQQFIHSVISSMSDVLIVADVQGRIQQVNRALEDLTGKTEAELRNRPLAAIFSAESQSAVDNFAEHIRSEAVMDCEVELLDAKGEAAPIAINCTPRADHDGRLSGVVITGRPLGELRRAYHDLKQAHDQLKKAQQQLVQSEKMASLGQLVAGVAHELNNPISFVFGNMHALKRYGKRLADYLAAVHAGLSEDEREALRKELKIDRLLQDINPLIEGSLEGAERVSEIVEDLRRFSTPNQQQLQSYDLNRVVHTAADWVSKARRERPTIELDTPEQMNLVGFEGYVHQILVNLVQNAADAVEPVADPRISIRVRPGKGTARIRVRDNGPGVPEDKLLRIFDPFFTSKPVGKGTGLGLYISYGLATDQCQGRLEVENLPGGGAAFTLTLPLELKP